MHPSMDDITLDALFYALGNGTRLKIVARLYHAKDTSLICNEAVADIDNLPPSTTSHHFRILREGGVIRSVRTGKECHNALRLEELESKFPGVLQSVLDNLSCPDMK